MSVPRQANPTGSEEKVNLLLVDEDENRLLVLENTLSSLDQNLVKAHSGSEALDALLGQDFAVAVLDARRPGMEGFETAAMIRQREKPARLPILFVIAADCGETHLARGCSLGAVDYIYTPIRPEILRAKVAVFVELKLQRERLEAEVKRNRFFSLSLDLLSVLGLDGYFRQLNPSWERTLGYTKEELTSRPFLEFVHPDDREATLAAMRKLAAGELVFGSRIDTGPRMAPTAGWNGTRRRTPRNSSSTRWRTMSPNASRRKPTLW